MSDIYLKVLKKYFKKSYYKIYYINRFFNFKTKSYREILNLNRNDCYSYFLDYFNFKSEKLIFNHRYYFKKNNRGFGEDAFHSMWSYLFYKFQPKTILEIGVYRGQTLSLFHILSKQLQLKSQIFGISPLTSDADEVSEYAVLDYQQDIQNNFNKFNLSNPNLFKAFSTEKKAIKFIESRKWDLIYIDGSHDYEVVIEDATNSIKNLSNNGILVLDDSSLYTDFNLELKGFKFFKGHPGPSKVFESLLVDDRVEYLFGVGHNNIFIKR